MLLNHSLLNDFNYSLYRFIHISLSFNVKDTFLKFRGTGWGQLIEDINALAKPSCVE